MARSGVFKLVGLIIIVVLVAAVYLLWPILSQKAEHRVGEIGLTSNEIAANGPLPGDVTLYLKELACQQKLKTGYYPSINGAELADAQRSGIFPCATFTGSYEGPHQVFAWRGGGDAPVASYLNNRKPGEIYIVGGESPPSNGPMPVGPFVAKADSASGKQVWRTYLWNGNTSDAWIGNTNLNILPNGNIVQSWSTHIVLLDGDTGLILRENTLPSGAAPPLDANFKHVTMAPDGTLILKDQTRPAGCKLQGTLAIMYCPPEFKKANSELVAGNRDPLEIFDEV